ncbi:von Willebrand factor A domain-containing protein 1 isoform X2 [Cavia porcellus]|uniref:von Willebrand factor A domain-containing protein 1 isoform X2 n=1 Tax=Cavia porcellus TaxID=10141 RepID=UPI000C87C2E4|nr:von Willebrand factor A domain-containing protein 1 isoform X2 [Cavia porcellus]
MLPWTALTLALGLWLTLARSGAERGEAQGPGCHGLHRQHWQGQPAGAVSCCLGPCREALALCGCG